MPVAFANHPGSHRWQSSTLDDPTIALAVPTGHSVQRLVPQSAAYVPIGHCRHVENVVAASRVLNCPGEHAMHVAFDVAAGLIAYVPAGHASHMLLLLAPSSSLYVPRTHGVHAAAPVGDSL